MRMFQRLNAGDKLSSLLKVDTETFAELLSVKGDSYVFSITFKVGLKNARKNPVDYSKVVVTAKRKEKDFESSAESLNKQNVNVVSSIGKSVNKNLSSSVLEDRSAVDRLKPRNGISMPKLPSAVQGKLYAGLQIVKDLENKEEFIDSVSINISADIADSVGNINTIAELVAPVYKRDQFINKELSDKQSLRPLTNLLQEILPAVVRDSSNIDPNDLLERVNSELVDPTDPIDDEITKRLDNKSYLKNPKIRMLSDSNGKSRLYYDLVDYYMHEVPAHPQEDSFQVYEVKHVTKQQEDVEFTARLTIPTYCRNLSLDIRFDLYKKDTNVVDETLTLDLSVANHVDAYESLKTYPEMSINPFVRAFSKSRNPNKYSIRILDKEPLSKVKGFNVYRKSFTKIGTTSGYVKVGYVENTLDNSILVDTSNELSAIRAIPVDAYNKESNLFSNIIIGPGYDVIGNLTILPFHFGKGNAVKIEVVNVPKNTVSLALYRRDCTINPDQKFKVHDILRGVKGNLSTFMDKEVLVGRVYEYYVVASTISDGDERPLVSNYAMFKMTPNIVDKKSISVSIGTPTFGTSQDGSIQVQFNVNTTISPAENERITESLKSQLGELYEQFLNPASNASSPLGDNRGVPEYKDLFMHEIVRTNLNTGERETFDLVTDGNFTDGRDSQRVVNIKPVNPFYAYQYQIFTYKKNPIELFKKYIARGVDAKGREWFYLPYKWLNPKASGGTLYADDKNGIPVTDAYESFTAEAYGLTASYRLEGSAQLTSLTQIVADRVDRNTVKISWQFEGVSQYNKVSLYDSFVVLKVVNGVRSFLGRCQKQFIYHELSESDVGSVYYIIVPIMSEYDIDQPGYSNIVTIRPEGLMPRIKITSASSKLFDEIDTSDLEDPPEKIVKLKSALSDIIAKKQEQ